MGATKFTLEVRQVLRLRRTYRLTGQLESQRILRMPKGKRPRSEVEGMKGLMPWNVRRVPNFSQKLFPHSLENYSTRPIRFVPIWVNLYWLPRVDKADSLVLDLGSRGPSTVTFIAFESVATWGGDVCSIIVKVKLFPKQKNIYFVLFSIIRTFISEQFI